MKEFIKNSSIYFISQVMIKGVSVILFSYLARILSIEDMGLYSLYLLSLTVLSLFLSFEIQSGYTRFYFEKDEKS